MIDSLSCLGIRSIIDSQVFHASRIKVLLLLHNTQTIAVFSFDSLLGRIIAWKHNLERAYNSKLVGREYLEPHRIKLSLGGKAYTRNYPFPNKTHLVTRLILLFFKNFAANTV